MKLFLIYFFITQGWTVEQLTSNYKDQDHASIKVYNGDAYIAYEEGDFSGATGEIHLRIGKLFQWVKDTIIFSSNSDFLWEPCIDIENGNIHIVFAGAFGDQLYYATNSGGTWQVYNLSFAYPAFEPFMKVKNDTLHLVYSRPFSSGITYAKVYRGEGNIEWSCNFGFYPSLEIDSAGHIHISFDGYGGGGGIYYATNASGSWVYNQVIPPYCSRCAGTSIKLDSDGNIHIAYRANHESGTPIYYALGYATNSSGSWTYIELDSLIRLSSWPSIFVDKNGYIHIIYTKVTGGTIPPEIYYFTNKYGNWQKFYVTQNSWWDEEYTPSCFTIDESGYGWCVFAGYPISGIGDIFCAKTDTPLVNIKEKNLLSRSLSYVPLFFKDEIKIKIPSFYVNKILIYDKIGNLVYENSSHFYSSTIYLKDKKIKILPKGVYFLKIQEEGKEIAKFKLIKF
ncbi:MAG: hypothetical protein ABIM62_00915 [candidate division WOR-3 bacterium]